jgi:AraC family transcriptional activator of pyochelin receptor
MYMLDGGDYSELFKRNFSSSLIATSQSAKLVNKFGGQSWSLKHECFDILHFRGHFEDDVRIRQSESPSHVSLHFQLKGHSNACISGFSRGVPMAKGEYNILNCGNPDSTYTFPKQNQYEYICVGLKQSFFSELLAEFGDEFANFVDLLANKRSFSVFQQNLKMNQWMLSNLKFLIEPSIPHNLLSSYLKAKIVETTVLMLSSDKQIGRAEVLRSDDKDKLHAAKLFLSANFLEDIHLSGVANQFMLNEFKLKKGFKELFGTTVFTYILKLRMDYAHYLVYNTDFSVGEIATIVGYRSDAAFIRAFRCEFGTSPGRSARQRFF